MTATRRVVAAVVLAAAIICGLGAAAQADCLFPPVVQNPTEVDAGQIDPGPTTATGSVASQFGYGGLDVVRYESKACIAGQSLTGRPGPTVSGSVYAVGKWVATVVVAVLASLAREVFTDGPLWQAVNAMFSPLTAIIPPQSLALLSALIAPLAVSVIVWRARSGDQTGWAMHRYAGIVLIGVVAVGCYTWTKAVPDAWGKTAGVALLAVQEVSTGTSGAPDVAVRDTFTDHVLMPMWAHAQLGSDPSAVETYAWRLRAASTVSRAEADQIKAGQTTFEELAKRKEVDYRQTAAEMKKTHPAAYAHLTGDDTTGQAWSGILGAGVAIVAGAVLVAALVVVGIGKTGSFAFVYGFPVAAAFLMLPRLQQAAGKLAVIMWDVTLASIVAVFVFVLCMLGPIHGLMTSTHLSMVHRFAGLALVYLLMWVVWKMRHRITRRWKVRKHVDDARKQVDVIVQTVTGNASPATDQPDDGTPRRRTVVHAETGQVEPDPAPEPASPEGEPDRERFTADVTRRVEAHTQPEPPAVDDPDAPTTPAPDTSDERVEQRRFSDRVTDRLERMELDELERRRAVTTREESNDEEPARAK